MVLQTTNKKGWFWYIPLHDDLVSVGIVSPFDYLFKGRGDQEQTYQEEVARCPAVTDRVSKATRATGYFATKDYSYRATKVAGDGWVLVGDAFGFLDPLYSSGVLLALKSGELAADAIVEGFQKSDLSAAQLGNWGPAFNDGVDRMRRLVCEYYDGFSFGNFVRNYPRPAGHRHRSADRRSLQRARRQGVAADGVALPAGQAGDSEVERRHAAGDCREQGQRTVLCPMAQSPEGKLRS